MNKSLLDTDILSEVGKGIDQTVVRNATAYRRIHGFLRLSVISVMEVIQGYQRTGGSARIQAFRSAIAAEEVLAFDQPAADLAGRMAGDLDRVGRPIGRCDPMIAAVAVLHGFELVTGIMPTHGLCRLSLGFSVLPRISLLASFERADIIWKSLT